MYGGGTQELRDILDTNHPSGLLATESCWAVHLMFPDNNNVYTLQTSLHSQFQEGLTVKVISKQKIE